MNAHPRDELADYALNILPAEREAEIAAHLQVCHRCQRRLHEVEETLALLAYTAPPVTPAPEAADRLIARVRELRAEEHQLWQRSPSARSRLRVPRGGWQHASRSGYSARVVYALAALAALLLLIVGVLGSQLSAAQARSVVIGQQVSKQQQAMTVLSAPDAVVRRLGPARPGYTSAAGTMVMAPGTGQGTLVLAHLPPLAPGKAYEFWLVIGSSAADEQIVPRGTFVVGADGSALHTFELGMAANQVRGAGISLEPAGGVKVPDSPMVMAMLLPGGANAAQR